MSYMVQTGFLDEPDEKDVLAAAPGRPRFSQRLRSRLFGVSYGLIRNRHYDGMAAFHGYEWHTAEWLAIWDVEPVAWWPKPPFWALRQGLEEQPEVVDELHRHSSTDLYGVFRGLGPRGGQMITETTAEDDKASEDEVVR